MRNRQPIPKATQVSNAWNPGTLSLQASNAALYIQSIKKIQTFNVGKTWINNKTGLRA